MMLSPILKYGDEKFHELQGFHGEKKAYHMEIAACRRTHAARPAHITCSK